jgi:hypothetical protein
VEVRRRHPDRNHEFPSLTSTLTARGQFVQEPARHAFPGGVAAEDFKPPSVANFHGDKSAALVEGEFCAQGGDFVALAGLTRRESLARGDTGIPLGQNPNGSVHGRTA